MFRRSRAVMFSSYGQRRSRWRLPAWFWLLLVGIATGAGGVVYLQESHLPPRLSAAESARLNAAYAQAEAERLRLAGELGSTTRQLDAATADKKTLGAELANSRAATERLRDDLRSIVGALPPDPRDGTVAVRAARFEAADGMLDYNLVLTRDHNTGKPMTGVLQLVVAGDSPTRGGASVALKPIALSIGSHEIVRGSQPLPDGFQPRQTTVQVLDRAEGRLLGMRVLRVK